MWLSFQGNFVFLQCLVRQACWWSTVLWSCCVNFSLRSVISMTQNSHFVCLVLGQQLSRACWSTCSCFSTIYFPNKNFSISRLFSFGTARGHVWHLYVAPGPLITQDVCCNSGSFHRKLPVEWAGLAVHPASCSPWCGLQWWYIDPLPVRLQWWHTAILLVVCSTGTWQSPLHTHISALQRHYVDLCALLCYAAAGVAMLGPVDHLLTARGLHVGPFLTHMWPAGHQLINHESSV